MQAWGKVANQGLGDGRLMVWAIVRHRAIGLYKGHAICVGLKGAVLAADLVGDHIVAVFFPALAAGVIEQVVCLSGKADDALMAFASSYGLEDIDDRFQGNGQWLACLFELLGRVGLGPVVHNCSGHDQDVAAVKTSIDLGEHVSSSHCGVPGDSRGAGEGYWATDEIDLPMVFSCGRCQSISHLSAGRITEIAHGVKIFARGAC